MATVYSGIQGFDKKAPELTFDFDDYQLASKEYLRDLKAFCKTNSACPHAGCLLRFPSADDYAQYVVLDYESLIHVALGDGYSIPDAHARGLGEADIIEHIEANAEWDAFTSSLAK